MGRSEDGQIYVYIWTDTILLHGYLIQRKGDYIYSYPISMDSLTISFLFNHYRWIDPFLSGGKKMAATSRVQQRPNTMIKSFLPSQICTQETTSGIRTHSSLRLSPRFGSGGRCRHNSAAWKPGEHYGERKSRKERSVYRVYYGSIRRGDSFQR